MNKEVWVESLGRFFNIIINYCKVGVKHACNPFSHSLDR